MRTSSKVNTVVAGIGTPENLTAAKSDKTANVEWTALSGVDGYAVYFRNSSGTLLGSKTVTSNSVTYIFSKYNTDIYVQIKVYTLDENGNKVYGSFCELVKAE